MSGIGMKSTKPGTVVGHTLQKFNPNPTMCTPVNSIDDISWAEFPPDASPEEYTKDCYKLPNGTLVGKIIVFVNVSWYDPDAYLTDSGDLNIKGSSDNDFQLINSNNNQLVDRIGAFAEVVTANFQAGIASIQDLTTNTLTITGNLISPVAYIEDLEVNTITAQTISAPQISQIEQEILDLTAKYSTASAILADIQATQALDPIIATGSDLDVNLIITNDLQVNSSLITNLINSKDQDTLFIQPLANAPISLLAGLMTLTPEGQVVINGDLAVTGKVLASKIEALESNLENLTAQTATISALTTKQLIIATSLEASSSATATSSAQVTSNTIVNSATIPTGETKVTIQNTKVTQDTYIYLTPTSSTNNQTLFVKSKQDNKFTIAIPEITDQDITFNYWLIQTIPEINEESSEQENE